MKISYFILVLLTEILIISGCESTLAGKDSTGTDSKSTDSGDTLDTNSEVSTDTNVVDTVNMPEGCGDGKLTEDEACDDGNNKNGDGCQGDCLEVEEGWSCTPPGKPCHQVAICGDGFVVTPELCDDGNFVDGDGCSTHCQVEVGYKCDGVPSECVETVCGDSKMEGAESCDDGNSTPFDGCSATCQKEPDCSEGACISECGDGLVLNEECDDGNKINGDGCSTSCEIEDGFTCVQKGCEAEETCTLKVSVIYRDFTGQYPTNDFGLPKYPDTSCDAPTGATGMVSSTLSSEWKPVQASPPAFACASHIGDWYSDAAAKNSLVGEITLYPDGNGNYVNMYGPNGEPWLAPPMITKCADGPAIADGSYLPNLCVDDCSVFTENQTLSECNKVKTALAAHPGYTCNDTCNGISTYNNRTCLVGPAPTCDQCSDYGKVGFTCLDPCGSNGNGYTEFDLCQSSGNAYDGNPLFFPVDIFGTDMAEGKVPEQYGYDGWPWEKDVPGLSATLHSFYFTSEITYWFAFDENNSATLKFTGDDDVWVFVNGQLAVDLGGAHVPLDGAITINKLNNYGMETGKVYRINIFHAERKMEGSSFKLTLGGFNTARSECTATCGDGIVSLGEQCDDGVNDGGYGECAEGCVLGEYCGDGVIQTENNETCDDGNYISGDDCPSSCRQIGID
ncbi:MAG: DUF4215 domain-containing protein [Deltaproteobacteria bacterium]|nr:DUF4215 domain-containing protein [Deltaproteobacteria bacterium]